MRRYAATAIVTWAGGSGSRAMETGGPAGWRDTMRYSRFPFLVAAALSTVGCSQMVPPGDPAPPARAVAPPPEPYSSPSCRGLGEPGRTAARDEPAGREVWAGIWRRHTPDPPLPHVDFAREMLVIAALGT